MGRQQIFYKPFWAIWPMEQGNTETLALMMKSYKIIN